MDSMEHIDRWADGWSSYYNNLPIEERDEIIKWYRAAYEYVATLPGNIFRLSVEETQGFVFRNFKYTQHIVENAPPHPDITVFISDNDEHEVGTRVDFGGFIFGSLTAEKAYEYYNVYVHKITVPSSIPMWMSSPIGGEIKIIGADMIVNSVDGDTYISEFIVRDR